MVIKIFVTLKHGHKKLCNIEAWSYTPIGYTSCGSRRDRSTSCPHTAAWNQTTRTLIHTFKTGRRNIIVLSIIIIGRVESIAFVRWFCFNFNDVYLYIFFQLTSLKKSYQSTDYLVGYRFTSCIPKIKTTGELHCKNQPFENNSWIYITIT